MGSFGRKILSGKISVACFKEGYNDEIISLNILSISFRDNKQKPRVEKLIVIFISSQSISFFLSLGRPKEFGT